MFLNFTSNIIQGPLAGISTAPFRRLIWKYSQPAFTCTEMISAKTLIHGSDVLKKRFITIAPDEGAVCFQLSGNNPIEIAEAVKRATDYGASAIDLNCGCPVTKIRKKGAGSRLLSTPQTLYQLMMAMKQNTHLPVSIKIRVDSHTEDKFNDEIIKAVNDAAPDFLIVHGRNWREHYETPCRHDEIKYFVENSKVPVIGNGDIACIDSLKKMLATGCAGVMIARAGMGQPWLMAKLMAELNGKNYETPCSREIADVFVEHITTLSVLLNSEKFAIIQARKFAKYYARHISDRFLFCEKVNACEDIATLRQICDYHFS